MSPEAMAKAGLKFSLPTCPGFYWAKWRIATEGTRDGDEPRPLDKWEVVDVFENTLDKSDDEHFMVHVTGVDRAQNLDGFIWGDGPLTPQRKPSVGNIGDPIDAKEIAKICVEFRLVKPEPAAFMAFPARWFPAIASHINRLLTLTSEQATEIVGKDKALEKIAKQMLSTEMDEDQLEHADFQGGWDIVIETARAVLSELQLKGK